MNTENLFLVAFVLERFRTIIHCTCTIGKVTNLGLGLTNFSLLGQSLFVLICSPKIYFRVTFL